MSIELARKLEEQYRIVKPWTESYCLELSTAFKLGRDAHAKLKQRIDDNEEVIFEDESRAHLIS